MVYAKTLSEYQRVMRWRHIHEEFGPNIKHISGVEKIIDDTLRRLPSDSNNKYEPIKMNSQCCASKLFTISRSEKNNEDRFPLNLLNVQI